MIFPRNKDALTINGRIYELPAEHPLWKLTVIVYPLNAAGVAQNTVYLEVDEDFPPNFGTPKNEAELDFGTHALAFTNEVYAFRLRASAGNALVTLRGYGP